MLHRLFLNSELALITFECYKPWPVSASLAKTKGSLG
jgi:hypothetical protein